MYFDPNSDAGVSSQFYYTVISNAGNGANNANLYCNTTSEPLLSHCSIYNSSGNGISLNSANISIQNSLIKTNGGTARTAIVDYWSHKIVFSNER